MADCMIVPSSGGTRHQARFVVLVDADAHLLFTLAMLLQRFNYHVCTAKTGEEALEMITVAVPSLVITALVLPGMSGLDLLNRLRQDPRTQSVPVIALTPAMGHPRSGRGLCARVSPHAFRGPSRPRNCTVLSSMPWNPRRARTSGSTPKSR